MASDLVPGTPIEFQWYFTENGAPKTGIAGSITVVAIGPLGAIAGLSASEDATITGLYKATVAGTNTYTDGTYDGRATYSGSDIDIKSLVDRHQIRGSGKGIRRATAQAGAAGSITLDSSASSTDDLYNGLIVQIIAGTGAGQARLISDYVGSTKVASISPNWITNPDSTSVFLLIPHAQVDVGLWRTSVPNVLQSGRVDSYFGAGASGVITSTLIAANAIGASQIASNAITAAKIAADAIGASQLADGALTQAKFVSTFWNKIADHVLRRSLASAAASADGDAVAWRSPLGALRRLVNRSRINGSNLQVYAEDDSTVAGTFAVTNTEGADPITEVDPS